MTEPPITMANTLGSPGCHLDPTTILAGAWQSFSPPQLDANAAMGARQRAHHGGGTPGKEAEESFLSGHTRLHPVHID